MKPEFKALFCSDQIDRINPHGTVGILTLWSKVDYVLHRLQSAGVDLEPETSPVAAVGTLYGNGLRELLRNLLYNPQIDSLLILGRDRSGSPGELQAFFAAGLEPHGGDLISYQPTATGEVPSVMRIRGTKRVIDNLVQPDRFLRPPRIIVCGSPREPAALDRAVEFLRTYQPSGKPVPSRLQIPLPEVKIECFPSNPRNHGILADDPWSAWKQLIFSLVRFGRTVNLAKGPRRELQNVQVVVENPDVDGIELNRLSRYGFDPAHLERYRRDILNEVVQADETYTYGNRLRAYFGLDSLAEAVRRLRQDPEDRKSYLVLWDPRRDLAAAKGHPCLVSLFFRRFSKHLTLTASFRTHNALDAWLINFFGLKTILDYVASRTGMRPGAITVFSHSISIDAGQLDRAQLIARDAALDRGYREDPRGYFRITLDGAAILVQHRIGDVTLSQYRHRKAGRLQQQIFRDAAVSDINHAIYLGRQLARAEACLQTGEPFTQE